VGRQTTLSWGKCWNLETAGREPTALCSCTTDCDFVVDEHVDVHRSAAAAAGECSTASLNAINVIHQHRIITIVFNVKTKV